jgi:putative membrane protein
MLRRELLLTVVGIGLSAAVEARPRPQPDFRTADLIGGSFAMRTSQLALQRTSNPDVINFAHAEIAEQAEVAQQLGAEPGSAPVRADQALILAKLERAGPPLKGCTCKARLVGIESCLRSTPGF